MSFQQFFTILWSRRGLAASCLSITVITTLLISLQLPKQFIATTSLVLDQRAIDPITGVNLPVQLMAGYMATQVDIIASHNTARKVVTSLKLDEIPKLKESFQKAKAIGDIRDFIAEIMLKDLDVKPSRESSILQVGYSSADPQFSALVANAFAQAYLLATVELKVQPAKLNADWFETQLDGLRKRMEAAQAKLSEFQQTHGIIMADDRLNLEDAHLTELARQLLVSQGQTYELVSRKKQLAEALAGRESVNSLQEILTNNFIQALKADLARAEGKFADLSERVDKKHPQYLQAQAEISSLKKKIQTEIGTVLNGIASSVAASQRRDDSLAAAIDEQRNKVLGLKKQRDEIELLHQEVESTQHSYEAVMQRSVQTHMESEMNQSNIAILNPAIPPEKADKPKVQLNVLLSIFIGTILGVGAALVAELLDRRVRSRVDITENLGLPVFGLIVTPRQNKKMRWPFTRVSGALS